MPYELDDLGLRIIGYNVPIEFYDDDRVLQCEIALRPDNTLGLCGASSGGGAGLTETQANSIFVRLDGNNWNLWQPAGGTQSIVGSFNLAGAAYEYKIGGSHGLSLSLADDVLMVGPLQGGYDAVSADATNAVVVGSYIAPVGVTPTFDHSVVVATYVGAGATLELDSSIVIGDEIFTAAAAEAVYSIIMGRGVLKNATYSSSDVILGGVSTGVYSGSSNTFLGIGVADDATTAEQNVVAGTGAAGNLTEGSNNVISGVDAGDALTTGDSNVIAGFAAGAALTTADGCVLYGNYAGRWETDSNKLFIDNAARTNEADGRIKALIYGVFAAAVADQTLAVNAYTLNLAGGANSQYLIQGSHALSMPGTGNLLAGATAGAVLEAGGTYNVLLGYGAGDALTTGDYNVLVGANAAGALDTGRFNVVIGYAGDAMTDSDSSVVIGYNTAASGSVNTSIVIGSNHLTNSTTSDADVIIGQSSVRDDAYEGVNNIFIGEAVAQDAVGASDNNVVIGAGGATNLTTGSENVLLGLQVALEITSATRNNAMGTNALHNLGSGDRNVGIGNQAGYSVADTNYNTYVGAESGFGAVAANNTALGAYSAYNADGGSGVFLGYQAGYYETAANKLFIDNAQRANEADARIKALVYGIFDAATANQYFTINGHLLALHDVSAPQLISTIAIGTAPLIVTSTTLVSNLNADLLDSQQGTYYLALGNATGILGSTLGGTGINNAGTFTNASNTTITGGGTLALGGFTLTVPATGTAALLATANVFTAGQTIEPDVDTITAFVVNDTDSNRVLTVDTVNNRIGIVVPVPSYTLDVIATDGIFRVGNTHLNNNNKYGRLLIPHLTIAEEPVYVFGAASVAGNNYLAIGGGYVGANAVTQIDFYTAATTTTVTGTSRITIRGDGTVTINSDLGIGIAPVSDLHVFNASGARAIVQAASGQDAILDLMEVGNAWGVAGSNGIRLVMDGGTNDFYIMTGSGAAIKTALTIPRVSTNVLIGEDFTDTGEKLRVYKVGTQLGLYGGAADFMTIAVAADGHTTFTSVDDTAGTEADIVFMPEGNVGVLVADPHSALEVNGAISSGGLTITASADDTDVSGVNVVWINANAAAIIIGGFTGGVENQTIYVSVIDHTHDVTLEHLEGVGGTQQIYMHDSADETLDNYGGWTLVCDGTAWHDASHAGHV